MIKILIAFMIFTANIYSFTYCYTEKTGKIHYGLEVNRAQCDTWGGEIIDIEKTRLKTIATCMPAGLAMVDHSWSYTSAWSLKEARKDCDDGEFNIR